ncbi:DUF2314 domain-containing protein [Pseudomarimonas salicorniae]|uniref:DUF2314 domain-containing protein n=1 Tax=Pseudomarimonas salicorniae TaxID=2933270 RepID=A0ABT0GGX9_9GAMM|nr:DUF2314 domain-containing protein [Lysobacter sp. CAU 1642]MCK7593800.1 DUF2314 domain-containing protein [Lysobacter sp. CAU 1642]
MSGLIWLLLAVGVLLVLWRVLLARSRAARATPMQPDDPWLLAAISRARASYPDMLALLATGQELVVKFPLANSEGELEHVWGGVERADEQGVEVSIVTPLLVGETPQGPRRIARDEIEDWQAFLPDGGIRGGFTTQAQLAVCRREGFSIPTRLQEQTARFLDSIDFSSPETSP